uniref:MLO-like protein n=1 Tax=Oryza punctata TaxID=4537 RepID=A0A0E0LDG0_ORYPU
MEESSITHTPTWVVAVVCFAIVSVSLAAERLLHHLGKARTSPFPPLSTPMLSPLQMHPADSCWIRTWWWICYGSCDARVWGSEIRWIEELEFECSVGIASRVDDHFPMGGFFTLCYEYTILKHKDQKALYSALERLKEELMLLGFISFVLSLSEGFIVGICVSENAMHLMLPCKKGSYRLSEDAKLCKKKGEVPLLSVEALHQLHIFIFILGLVHVVFCATTILLGGAKIRKWKLWETEIQQEMQQKVQQREATPVRIARNQQGEFVRERTKGLWMKLAVVSWIIAFLKQFHDSVSKSDYRALRSAFGLKHFPSHPDFNFHKYMVRALEHDFKRVVGIRMAYILLLLLVVGAKLEHIITRLAQEAAAAASLSHGTEGTPNVKPSKEHFWFGRPEIVLTLIHFILFQNSFEIGFFIWVLVTFGFDSCIMEKKVYAISRLVIGVLIQVICSYVTLPLYAIVTHMDGGIKLQGLGSGLHESVAGWALDARKKKEQQSSRGSAGATTTDVEVNRSEHFGASPRSALALPPSSPDLVEIVSVVGAVNDDDSHYRR